MQNVHQHKPMKLDQSGRYPVKMVFFDIDGTLFNNSGAQYVPSSIDTLHQLKNRGIKCVVCTGRSMNEYLNLPSILVDIPFDGLITSSGAQVMAHDQILKAAHFSIQEVDDILHRANDHNINLYFQDSLGTGLWKQPDALVQECLTDYLVPIPPVRAMKKDSVNHIIAFGKEHIDRTITAQLQTITYHRSGPLSVDIYPPGTDKSKGIDIICKFYDIDPAQCMAFGDSFNDVEMLRHVGIGVAMGNGSDVAKAAADITCEPMLEDGIYKTCLRLGLIQEEQG